MCCVAHLYSSSSSSIGIETVTPSDTLSLTERDALLHDNFSQAAQKAATVAAAAGMLGRLALRSSCRTCGELCGTTSPTVTVTGMKHSSYPSMWHA
jgi:hypothetical protein